MLEFPLMSGEWQPIRDAAINPANNSTEKQEAIKRALELLEDAGVEEAHVKKSEGVLTNELAQRVRRVVSALDPNIPLGSLVLFTKSKRTYEISNIRRVKQFRANFKRHYPEPENPEKYTLREKMVKELPDTPPEWVELMENLDKNTSKQLLITLRRRLLRQGDSDNYSMPISNVNEVYVQNPHWDNATDKYVAFLFQDHARPTS